MGVLGSPVAPVKNVLLIAVDDLRPELACFGKPHVHTPNIDRLASRSTIFERAYCQFPQCMPSRASMMTGMRPPGFRLWSNELATCGQPTLPGHLRSNGLTTVSCGKVYHKPLDDAVSWDELHTDTFAQTRPGRMEQWFHDYQLPENQRLTEAKFTLTLAEVRERTEGLPPISECADAPDDAYVDATVARRAIEVLGRLSQAGKPFFLAAGFYRPHLPWVAPKRYWDLYERDRIDLADNPFLPEGGVGISDLCDFLHYGDAEIQATYSDIGRYRDDDFPALSEAKQRECIHAYQACVSFVDAQIGRVIDELERLGLAATTAIVFWGDNGWHLGEHLLWSKVTHFDEATRVPLLVSVPGTTAGERCRAIVETVDVYPTICGLLDLPIPAHCEGGPLVLGSNAEREPTRKPASTVTRSGRSIITDRYRLTRYHAAGTFPDEIVFDGRGLVELYDHDLDPAENRNVAQDPQYSAVVADLSRELEARYPPQGTR